jgi:hypothetical protein
MGSGETTQQEDSAPEMRAIVDLVDANVSPVADADAWEEEIAAHRQGEREELPPRDATLKAVIDISDLLG